MSYTFPKHDDNDNQNRRGGRPLSLSDMSPQAAHAEANRLLAQGLS